MTAKYVLRAHVLRACVLTCHVQRATCCVLRVASGQPDGDKAVSWWSRCQRCDVAAGRDDDAWTAVSRSAMYEKKKTKMSAPTAAPNVRVTMPPGSRCSVERTRTGKGGTDGRADGKFLSCIHLSGRAPSANVTAL